VDLRAASPYGRGVRAPEHGRGARAPVRAIGLLLALELAAFTISTIPGVRSHPGFDPLFDGWLQGAAYVTVAVLALMRPLMVQESRAAWAWIAGALALRALGFVIFLGFVRGQQPPPYPSAADAAWLAMPIAMLVGLALLARPLMRGLTLGVALDGIVGGAAAAGVGIALTDGTIARLTAHGVPQAQLATNIAYPVTDLMLLVAVLGLLTITG
jgi:hypothetical protein